MSDASMLASTYPCASHAPARAHAHCRAQRTRPPIAESDAHARTACTAASARLAARGERSCTCQFAASSAHLRASNRANTRSAWRRGPRPQPASAPTRTTPAQQSANISAAHQRRGEAERASTCMPESPAACSQSTQSASIAAPAASTRPCACVRARPLNMRRAPVALQRCTFASMSGDDGEREHNAVRTRETPAMSATAQAARGHL